MDLDAIVEKIRDAIVGDLRKEFSEFKAEVRGQLEGMQKQLDGFRIAIETMNKRIDSMERRMTRWSRGFPELRQGLMK